MWHDLARWAGLTNPSGAWYLFWSGIGSDVSKLTLLAGLFHVARSHRHAHKHPEEKS